MHHDQSPPRSLPPLLLFLSLLSLGVACQGDGNRARGDIRALSNGPGLPQDCEVCWVEFQACVDGGVELSTCEEAAVACALGCEAPPPPEDCDHCFAGYEACVEVAAQGMADVSDCVAGLEGCLASCEAPPGCDPAVDLDCGDWHCAGYCGDLCFGDAPGGVEGGEPCSDEQYMACLAECRGTEPEPPPPPCDPAVDLDCGDWHCAGYCGDLCYGDDTRGNACTEEMYLECLAECRGTEPEPPPPTEPLDCPAYCSQACDDTPDAPTGNNCDAAMYDECLADCEAHNCALAPDLCDPVPLPCDPTRDLDCGWDPGF